MHELKANCKVWVYSTGAAGVFGDGKARLLDAIARHGSLQAAAAELTLSYRKAWADLRKAEACLGLQLVERVRGGHGGGHMSLTDEARVLVDAYGRFRAKVTACLQEALGTLTADLRARTGGAGHRQAGPGIRPESAAGDRGSGARRA